MCAPLDGGTRLGKPFKDVMLRGRTRWPWLLAKSIHLTVDTLGYQWLRKANTYTPKIVVNTKITHDAGHRIPDG